MDILDKFKNALSSLGIGYQVSGNSIRIETCPECGKGKYRVILRTNDRQSNKPLLGRCQTGSCQTNYSSISYLVRSGMTYNDALIVHGFQVDAKQLEDLICNKPLDVSRDSIKRDDKKTQPVEIIDPNDFFTVGWNESCPISRYAISRGYIPYFKDVIKVDLLSQAIVFIVKNGNGDVIGAQRRFINVDSGTKTKTSHGFEKSKHIMVYERKANIAICEGPFTALSAWHYGYCAVCTFGSGITNEQLDLINDLSNDLESNVFVAEDNDDAGKKYSNSVCAYFYWKSKPVGILRSSVGNDLNDCWMKKEKLIKEQAFMFNPAIPSSVCAIV